MDSWAYDWRKDPEITKKSMERRDVYLAAPFFNVGQEQEILAVEIMLTKSGLSFFSPRLECLYVKHSANAAAQADRAFFLNVRHLGGCKLIVAGLTWPDVGTAWELGYAHALHQPRLGFSSNDKAKGNLMINKTVNAMVPFNRLETAISCIALDIRERSRSTYNAVVAVNDPVMQCLPEE